RPHAVVVQRTVDEDDAGERRVESLAAGVGVGQVVADLDLHQRTAFALAAFSATFSARFRSSIRSSASSSPIDRRIVPGVMPACASAASSMRKCVVEAGWITSE